MPTKGRTRCDRIRCFHFAKWMQKQAPRVPTVREIEGYLQLSYDTARRWRNDWLAANSPVTNTNQSENKP